MSFSGSRIAITILLKIELPGHTILACEGGEILFQGDKYTSADDVFGNVLEASGFASGEGDESPTASVTFGPPTASGAIQLSNPAFQGSPAVVWKVSYDVASNLPLINKVLFAGLVDYTIIDIAKSEREVLASFITEMARFLNTNKGNTLNGSFHQSVWAGELGLDNATGVGKPVAWGVQGPPGRTTSGGVTPGYDGDTDLPRFYRF